MTDQFNPFDSPLMRIKYSNPNNTTPIDTAKQSLAGNQILLSSLNEIVDQYEPEETIP